MQVKVLIRTAIHSLSGDKKLDLRDALIQMSMEEGSNGKPADVGHAAILFIGDNNAPIPYFVSYFINPYEENSRIVIATDCETFKQAVEMKDAATAAAEVFFGDQLTAAEESSWTNPTLN